MDKNEVIIFDVKTTKKRKDRDHGIYPEYAYQLAAYANAFRETYGIDVKAVYALWVNKEKPEFKAVKVSNISVAFEGFLAALKLYKQSKYELFDN
jgi:5-methylcytosine-specific restriction endonuclease McrBC regulatory subunit McrC